MKNFLPLFLFKWNGNIELSPDIDDIKQYCLKNQEDSYLLSSFKKMALYSEASSGQALMMPKLE